MEITDKIADFAQEAGYNVSKAAKQLGNKGDRIKKAEQRVVKDGFNYIRQKPLRAISLAVGFGFLLSRVLSGR